MRLMAFPKTNSPERATLTQRMVSTSANEEELMYAEKRTTIIHHTITTSENNEDSVNQLYIRQQTTTNDYSRLQTFNQRLTLDRWFFFAASNLINDGIPHFKNHGSKRRGKENIWSASELQNEEPASSNTSQPATNADKEAGSNGTVSDVSQGKNTTFS